MQVDSAMNVLVQPLGEERFCACATVVTGVQTVQSGAEKEMLETEEEKDLCRVEQLH
jgi:hypothetical protein